MYYFLIATFMVLITLISALAGRLHGGGWDLSWDRIAAKVWLGLMLAVTNYLIYGLWWLSLAGIALTIWAMSTGHGRVYEMKGANLADPKRETLEKLFGWLWPGRIDRPLYSWFIMGLKGLFIALPIAPVGFLLCFLWPASYYWGYKLFNSNEPAEWVCCGFAGLLSGLVIALYFLGV